VSEFPAAYTHKAKLPACLIWHNVRIGEEWAASGTSLLPGISC